MRWFLKVFLKTIWIAVKMYILYIKQLNILLKEQRFANGNNLWFPSKATESAGQIQSILILCPLQSSNSQAHMVLLWFGYESSYWFSISSVQKIKLCKCMPLRVLTLMWNHILAYVSNLITQLKMERAYENVWFHSSEQTISVNLPMVIIWIAGRARWGYANINSGKFCNLASMLWIWSYLSAESIRGFFWCVIDNPPNCWNRCIQHWKAQWYT